MKHTTAFTALSCIFLFGISPVAQAISYDENMVRIAIGLDANRNRSLEDSEIQAAVRLWITGETVPTTDSAITDGAMTWLIELWISGETMPVCKAAPKEAQ